jgi:hypothetical protein
MSSKLLKNTIAIALALLMALPVGMTMGGIENTDEPMKYTPSANAGQSASATLGNSIFKVWVDGSQHDARLMLSMSEDSGMRWTEPKAITGSESNPMNVQIAAGLQKIHVVWQDGLAKLLKTGYMTLDADGEESRIQTFNGENPSLTANGDDVAFSYVFSGIINVQTSHDDGATFQSEQAMNGLTCQDNRLAYSEGQLQIVASAGIRDPETGIIGSRGLYFECIDCAWSMPQLITSAGSVSDLTFSDGYVTWTEVIGQFENVYQMKQIASGEFDEKRLLSSEELPREFPASQQAASRLPPKKWTYIGYVDADNNLNNYGLEDVNEMEMIGSDEDLNIVVLFDGLTSASAAYYIEQDANTGSITSPEIPLTDINPSWGTELNMGNPQTAIDFVNYVYENYPAEHYMWDMWDHGGSWLYGMCSDDTNGDDLTMLEVRNIYETLRTDNNKIKLFDVAGYDECLMSDVSNAYDEIPFIDYICNSEDSIAGDGWEYNLVLGPLAANPDMGGEQAAWLIFDAYVDMYGTSGGMTTMSIINSTMFFLELIPAINNLAQKGIHDITTHRTALRTAANNAKDWQGYTWQKDLIGFCMNIVSGLPANAIRTAAQEVITAGTSNPVGTQYGAPAWEHDRAILIHNQNSGEYGITIYAASPPYNNLYDTMTFTENKWDEFYKVLWGSDASDPNVEPSVVITNPTDGGFVTIDTTVPVTGTASDDGSVTRVEVAIDTEHWVAASGTTAWSYSWDTTGRAPGWHYISARSFDGQDYSAPYQIAIQIIIDPDLPDLTLWSSDIGFDIPSPNEGQTVTIDATVYNVGTVDPAVGVQIGFYDGLPVLGDLIGIVSANPGTLPAGNSSGWGQVTWNTAGEAGYHTIYAVADPLHTVPELTDANNSAFKNIIVSGFNVEIVCADNESTVQAGDSHTYQLEITNTGTQTDRIDLTIDNPTGWTAHFNNNPLDYPGDETLNFAPKATSYRNYAGCVAQMYALEAANPSIIDVSVIGTSWEGRDILAVKVSDNVGVDESEPESIIMGLHHAREWMTTEIAMYYLEDLAAGYGNDPRATWNIDNREIFIIPIVNPDGYVYSQEVDSSWRKNRRVNGDGTYGVDLNRNYDGSQNGDPNGAWGGAGSSSYTGDDTYCGPYAFSEPETQAIRDFVIAHDPSVTISYHSYAQELYWPWGYDTGVQPPDVALQSNLGTEMAAINGYSPMQSAELYLTTGDSDDWIYGYSEYVLLRETYPFTIEVDSNFQPPVSQIDTTCELNLGVNYLAAEASGNPALDFPELAHIPMGSTTDTTGPYAVSAEITSTPGLEPGQTKLFWTTTGTWNEVMMTNTAGNIWEANIPGQPDGSWVRYYIETEDVNGARSSEPQYTPYEDHDFFVGNDVVTYSVTLASLQTKIVNFTVVAPVSAMPSEFAKIGVAATSQNDSSKSDSIETLTTVMPALLLVNDGNSGIGNYQAALDNSGYLYDVGTPTTDLGPYKIVIWATDGSTTITLAEEASLIAFLNSGGNLFINGEDIGYDLGTSAAGESAGFYRDYLHADYIADDSNGVSMNGIAGDEISDGMSGLSITGNYPSSINPYDGMASAIFTYNTAGNAGIKVDTGTYRLVYLACEYFEGTDSQANKDLLMDRILNWLMPLPKINDVEATNIDTHADGNTYSPGSQDVKATVTNLGLANESAFNTRCVITEMQSAGAPATLLSEEFLGTVPPTGWTQTGPTNQWSSSATSSAGGTAPEARFAFVSNTNVWRLYTSAIDTTGYTVLELSWANYYNDWGVGVTVKVQTSTDHSTWHDTGWQVVSGSGDVGPGPEAIEISNADVGSSTFYVSFTVDGNAYQLDYWYIDNVLLRYAPIVTEVEVYNQTRSTVGTLNSGSSQQLTWNYGFPNEYQYRIDIYTELATDEKPSNNRLTIVITIEGTLAEFNIPVLSTPGWNFISFPLVLTGSPETVLNDLAGDGTATWDVAKWYDPTDHSDHWKTFRLGSSSNDLASVNNCMGLWVHVTSGGLDNFITVEGNAPSSTEIQLYVGWNLVGYPSDSPSLASATLPALADMVSVFLPTTPYIADISNLDSVSMSSGNAYWVHVTSDCTWNIVY